MLSDHHAQHYWPSERESLSLWKCFHVFVIRLLSENNDVTTQDSPGCFHKSKNAFQPTAKKVWTATSRYQEKEGKKQKIKSLKLIEEGDKPMLSAEMSMKVPILEGEEQTVLPSVGPVCRSAGWEEPQQLTASMLTTPEEHEIITC